MITFNMVAKINESKLILLTKKEAAKRIQLLAFEVEAEAKLLCSVGAGSPPEASQPNEPPRVRTGNLRASIRTEAVEGSERMSWRIGPSVIYGKWLEFSTRRMRSRPFMRPALATIYRRFASYFRGLF